MGQARVSPGAPGGQRKLGQSVFILEWGSAFTSRPDHGRARCRTDGRVSTDGGAECPGQALGVGLGRACAAADHARAADAEVHGAFDPVLGVGAFVMKTAQARLTGREEYPRK